MIIPVGHDESTTRRLPWVSFGIIGLCLVAWIANVVALDTMERLAPEDYQEKAQHFWEAHPFLEPGRDLAVYMVLQEQPDALSREHPFTQEQWKLWLLNKQLRFKHRGKDEFGDRLDAIDLQEELDRLVYFGFQLEADEIPPEGEQPAQRLGLVPANLHWYAFITHMFMHASWAHILGNLLIFFIAAPALEDRWGRPLFTGFYLMAGAFAGAFYTILSLGSKIPMVGASGAIAGVLGAFLVFFWHSKIKFAYYFFPPFFGTFLAPAWLVLPLWFANEGASAWMAHANMLQSHVAYWAHVGGFLFGTAFATSVRGFRLEERFINRAIDRKVTVSLGKHLIPLARQALERCSYEEAFLLLEEVAANQPDDPEVLLAFWEAAVAFFKPEEAAEPLCRWLRAQARGKHAPRAAQIWARAVAISPELDLDPRVLLRFVPPLRERCGDSAAVLALQYVLSDVHEDLSSSLVAHARSLASGLDSDLERRALQRLLALSNLPEEKRHRYAKALADLETPGACACRDPLNEVRLARRRGVLDDDGAIPIEFDDDGEEPVCATRPTSLPPLVALDPEAEPRNELAPPAEPSPRFGSIKAVEAIPVSIESDHLRIRTGDGREAKLDFGRIQGIATPVVSGLHTRPVLLIDLLLNWRLAEAETLQLVRMRSSEFDPRSLIPGSTDPMQAIRDFVLQLARNSRADALPSPEALSDPGYARYEELAHYEREVLQVERA